MLKKAHSFKLLEDFGLELNARTLQKDQLKHFVKKRGLKLGVPTVYFYDNDMIEVPTLQTSQVVRVNALWFDKDLKLKCKVADTIKKKKRGLQGTRLNDREGLFFPYPGPTDVVFHQGSVNYPLDIIFMRAIRGSDGGYHNEIAQIEADTRVGSAERWGCKACDCVIETLGGFCFENDVNVGDRLAYFAVSEQDEIELQAEREMPMPFLSLAAELI